MTAATQLEVDDSTANSLFSIMDSSRLSVYVVSMVLIVYGSFRSLKLEKDKSQSADEQLPLTSCQAALLPLGASGSLLIMFLFFDSLQVIFTLMTAVLAIVALTFLATPLMQYAVDGTHKYQICIFGRHSAAELLASVFSTAFVLLWAFTGHWLLMDCLGMGLCVAMIAFVRLPSLKVSTLLLVGLLIYDVFWVFFSARIFNTNVMVKVATTAADNPLGILARKFNFDSFAEQRPKLSLPGKLVFPSYQSNSYAILGLGDIVMPGLLLCFVLRYDEFKKATASDPPVTMREKITYFHCSLIGYLFGLITASLAGEIFRAAQPALLYLVPFTLLPLCIMAYLKGDLRNMWNYPFHKLQPVNKEIV